MFETNEIYKTGQRAFYLGFSDDDCPYAMGNGSNASRIQWLAGWYHEQIRRNVGHILKKYKLSW